MSCLIQSELTLRMLVTQGALSHISQLDCAFRACIHEPITALRVKFGRSDDFRKLLHVGWLDVDDVEALVLNVQVPQVYSEVVTANKCLTVTIDRNAVDVIGMGIRIGPARYSSNDGVVVRHSGELQLRGIFEFRSSWSAPSGRSSRSQFM